MMCIMCHLICHRRLSNANDTPSYPHDILISLVIFPLYPNIVPSVSTEIPWKTCKIPWSKLCRKYFYMEMSPSMYPIHSHNQISSGLPLCDRMKRSKFLIFHTFPTHQSYASSISNNVHRFFREKKSMSKYFPRDSHVFPHFPTTKMMVS